MLNKVLLFLTNAFKGVQENLIYYRLFGETIDIVYLTLLYVLYINLEMSSTMKLFFVLKEMF